MTIASSILVGFLSWKFPVIKRHRNVMKQTYNKPLVNLETQYFEIGS